MKKQKLPAIIIEGVKYELLIASTKDALSVCYKCDLGLRRCSTIYSDFEECPCHALAPTGYRGRSYLRAKKAGQ